MDNTDLSVIVPCHNLEKYITPLLVCFEKQNYDNIKVEFIFVLDACKDNTKVKINSHMKNFNYKIIEVKNYSCGLSRNDGFTIAKGKYIWFIDGDDTIIGDNVFINLIQTMEREKLSILQIKYVSDSYKYQCPFMVWQYIFKKDFIKDIKFKPIQPHEDREFYLELINKYNITHINCYIEPIYCYHYNRPGSNTTINRMFPQKEVSDILKENNKGE